MVRYRARMPHSILFEAETDGAVSILLWNHAPRLAKPLPWYSARTMLNPPAGIRIAADSKRNFKGYLV